jgi:integrase
MGIKRKSKKVKNLRFGRGSTYGEKYEYKGVRFWVYKREGYDHCTTKIKIKGQKEIRRSLDHRDLEESKDKVKEMIFDYLQRLKSGQNLKSRSFKIVSQEYLKKLKRDKRVIDSKLKKYKSVITLYLDEYFGDMKMESITEKVVEDYRIWRDEYWDKKKDTYTYNRNGKKVVSKRGFLKKPVSLSTLHKEDVVLRKVIEYGRLSGDLSKDNPLEVKYRPFQSTRRPSFTQKEWNEVLDRSKYRSSKDRLWENNKGKKDTTDCINHNTYNQRVLLHDYISFMVGSGLRTTKSINLKWKDIIPHEFIQEINGKYKKVKGIQIYVSGKCQGQSKNVPAWRSKSVPLGLKNIGS